MVGNKNDSTVADLTIQAFAQENAELVDLVATLAYENFVLQKRFIQILTAADNARLEAQRQCEDLWASLWREREAALDRERRAA